MRRRGDRGSAGVDGWVHTAAVVAYGRFEDVPPRDVPAGRSTPTCHGSVHAARVALRQFRAQGHGTLVLTGSLLGEIATPYMSSYVTSKWAVRGLARVLAVEARDDPDMHVCIVSPGGVDTPVYLQAANYAGLVGRPPPPVDSPEKVARADRADAASTTAATVGRGGEPGDARRVRPVAAGVRPAGRAVDASGRAVPRAVEPHDGNVFQPLPAGDVAHGRWGRRPHRS